MIDFDTIAKLRRDFGRGKSLFKLASELQRAGVPTPDGAPKWKERHVRALLLGSPGGPDSRHLRRVDTPRPISPPKKEELGAWAWEKVG
jgi:hypothetical protein